MGAAVGEAGDGVRVGEHLADAVEGAVGVVEERHVEERAALVLGEQVVGEVEGDAALAAGPGGDARRTGRARSRAGRRARTCGRRRRSGLLGGRRGTAP